MKEKKKAGPKGPRKYTPEFIENEAQALLEWIKVDASHKTYLGTFAVERGYDRKRLQEFSESNESFALAYKKAKAWQENKFLNKAITKEWDPGFTRYVMARVCDPVWKQSWDSTEQNTQIQTPNVTINKIVSKDDDE